MKIKYLIICIAFLTSFSIDLYSQSDFIPGYIIRNDNTIISGLIDYGNKKSNYNKCVFQVDKSSERITYSPEEIKGYRYDGGKYYVSMKPDSSYTKNVFLEYLFDGIVNLYYFFDDAGDHYYISKDGFKLTELRNDLRKVYAVQNKAGVSKLYAELSPVLYEKESKEYIGTLKTFFQDSQKTMKNAEITSLNINSLIKISEDYHNEVCPNEECIAYSKRPLKIKIGVGPLIGASISRIFINQASAAYLFEEFQQNCGYFLGALMNFKDPYLNKNISAQLEPSFFKNEYLADNSSLSLSSIKLPVLFKYSLNYKIFQPSFQIGMVYNRFLNFNSISDHYNSFQLMGGYDQFGITAGFGTDITCKTGQRIIIQARYEYLAGQHHTVQWGDMEGVIDTKIRNINLMIGYTF